MGLNLTGICLFGFNFLTWHGFMYFLKYILGFNGLDVLVDNETHVVQTSPKLVNLVEIDRQVDGKPCILLILKLRKTLLYLCYIF